MQSKAKVGVLGGDSRQIAAGEMFAQNGYECAIWGCYSESGNPTIENTVKCVDWRCAVSGADVILLPLPLTTDGVRLNCGKNTENREIYIPRITEIIQSAKRSSIIFGGKIPAPTKRFAEEHGVKMIDYYEFEEFQIKNAAPTAEGAICIAMKELDITLAGSEIAVIGYGRIGKALSHRLIPLGARTTCVARSGKDLAWASCDGCAALSLTDFIEKPPYFDVIFNTVPHIILGENVLNKLSKRTIIIDLASQNGGVDPSIAERFKIKVIKALSLPGKTSPITAGKIVYETVIDAIRKETVK